jgi:hypothetical protein
MAVAVGEKSKNTHTLTTPPATFQKIYYLRFSFSNAKKARKS